MIPHELKIGQRIYSDIQGRWGKILLIEGFAKDTEVYRASTPITYKSETDGEVYIACANCVYPQVRVTFHGECICEEINRDEMEDDYPYYCPALDENCFEFELDK